MWPITPSFIQAIKSPVHTMRVRLTVLDTNLAPVPGGVFYDVSYTADATGILIDGSVDVDISRGARRTFTANMLNSHGEFSPNSQWSGMFYVNRLVRIERGIEYSPGNVELVPVGTFFLDAAEVTVERNMSMINLQGTDGWKKLAKAQLGYAKSYAAGTAFTTVISDLLTIAGVTQFVMDDFSGRATAAKVLGAGGLAIERNDLIGDVLTTLATNFGIYCYFDPLGRFVVTEIPNPNTQPVVWTYDPGDNNNLLMVKSGYKDEGFCNAVCVVGTGDKNHTVVSNRADTNPSSPTNVTSLGRRTDYYESDTISTQAQADACANKRYLDNMQVIEDVALDTICNPAFEGGDIIAVRETEFAHIDTKYIIRAFSVPLASSRLMIKLQRSVGIA
jgi:hypothetical protein